MPLRINGHSSSSQSLSADLQGYACYASSPGAFSNPAPNPTINEEVTRLVNIAVTGNLIDQSQKNFEVLLMSISLRAMPVILQNPVPVQDLREYTVELSGEGFVWKFAVERSAQFFNYTPFGTPGPVGLLIDEIDGLVLPSGVRVTSIAQNPPGWSQNIAFSRIDTL